MTVRRAPMPPAARLWPWVERMAGVPAVVWGDFVLDEYWRCLSQRVSREAPVLILDYQDRETRGGGAANAALNLAALGARVRVVGWVGRDAAGRELRAHLEAAGIDTRGLLEHERGSTVVKTRIVAGSAHTAQQQVVRVDRGASFPLGPARRAALSAALEQVGRGARAVVLSDYGYGSVTPELARKPLRAWRTDGVVVGLDARYRLLAYRGVTLATPNEGEAGQAAGIDVAGDGDLARAANRIRRRTGVAHLIITRGRDGLTLWDGGAGVSLAAFGAPEAVDVTGAGDAVVAAATLALAAGATSRIAAALANVAGSVAVSRRGTVAVTRADVRRALSPRRSNASRPAAARARTRR
ncbi:MAG TPA: PfkB family carbohydrate kinase [Candidatus Limnocylindria bacterium]|nr:PfkB family carbohydrate kinase [Candidatus Limnocylindria bacterium]